MKIVVKMLIGKAIVVTMHHEDTLKDLQAKVKEMEKVPPREQCLIMISSEEKLKTDVLILLDDRNDSGLLPLPFGLTGDCQLFLATTKQNVELTVEPSDLVKDVKEKLFEKKAVSSTKQRLNFGGMDLEDGRQLWSYGIQNESTLLNLVTQMQGIPIPVEFQPSDQSSDGVCGGDGGEQEERQLQLQLLPKVVLEIIIEELENPKDVGSLLEAFPLIEQVVIISKSCKLLFDKIFPLLFIDLDKKDILNCREVCRWWKSSVDGFIEGHPSHRPYDANTFSQVQAGYRYSDLESKGLGAVMIRCPDGFSEKMDYIQNKRELGSSKLPSFLGKSVHFMAYKPLDRYRLEAPLVDHYNVMEEVLREYGSEIRHVSIPLTAGARFYSPEFVYHYPGIQKCLQQLSQVTSLTLETAFLEIKGPYLQTDEEANDKLKHFMSRYPIPDMPHLDTLILQVCHHTTADHTPIENVFVEVLKKVSKQLRSLSVTTSIWGGIYWVRGRARRRNGIPNLECPNLIELKIVPCIRRNSYDGRIFKAILAGLKTHRLEKLTVVGSRAFWIPSLKVIFEACERLPVKVLNIDPGQIFRFYPSPKERLPILPSVTAFTLYHQDPEMPLRVKSLCFLKALPNLEYLEIHVVDVNEPGHLKGFMFLEGLDIGGNGEKMTVWELLPRLKLLVADGKRFPREIYYKK